MALMLIVMLFHSSNSLFFRNENTKNLSNFCHKIALSYDSLIKYRLNTFEEIYTGNSKILFRVAKKMVGDRDDVSDIVQEVFIDLFRKMNNGLDIRHVKSWLYRVTCNKCIDCIRKRKRFQPVESIEDYGIEQDSTGAQEIRSAIIKALAKLKPRERMLAVLYSEELSYKEIAEATGIKITSVGKMISRTLEKIELEYKNLGYELP